MSDDRDHAGRRVCVVTDDRALAETARRVLEGSGWEVVVAAGAAARPALEVVDVALVDLDLPLLDGWFLLSRLVARRPETHLVACSRDDGAPVRERARTFGAAAFVALPTPEVEIERAVARARLGALIPR